VRLSWFLTDGAELKCANEAQKSYSRFILNCWLVLDGVTLERTMDRVQDTNWISCADVKFLDVFDGRNSW